MSNLNLGPKEGDIDGDGRRYVYGQWWNPWVIPLGRENKIMPLPDYDIELQCYKAFTFQKDIPPGAESRGSHFKKTVNHIWGDPDGIWYFEWNPNADRILEAKLKHKFLTVAGHGGCVHGNTGILDPITGLSPTIKSLCDDGIRPWVQTLHGPILADVPYLKGREELYELRLSNGASFKCTAKHRLLTTSGWKFFSDVSEGDLIYGYAPDLQGSTSGNGPSVQMPDAWRCSETASDSPGDCHPLFYLRGEQLQSARDSARESSPSQGDVLERSQCSSLRGDGPLKEPKRIQTYLLSSLHSTLEPSLPIAPLGKLLSPRFSAETFSPLGVLRRSFDQSRSLITHLRPSGERRENCDHRLNMDCADARFAESERPFDEAYDEPSELGLPIYLPQVECFSGAEKGRGFSGSVRDSSSISCLRVSLCRVLSISKLPTEDFYDLNVPVEHHYFAEGAIHHNSGKSEFGVAWMAVNYLIDPRDTKGLITSLTLKSARGKIWGSMSEAWQQLERFRRKVFNIPDGIKAPSIVPGKLLAQGMIRYEYQGVSTDKAGIELIPGDTDKAKESAEKVQGYHRGHIIAILDELASLDHALMKTVENNLFTNWDCDVLGLFNPDSYFDPGGKYSTPIDGFGSLKGDEDGWATPWGYCVNLRGSRSPNVVAKAKIWRGLMTYEAYTEKLEKVGSEDKEFCKMFEGRFSAGGTVDCIYDEGTIINSMADKPVDPTLWVERPTPVGFFDPSFAHGGDRAILYKGRLGRIKLPGAAGTLKVLDLSGEKQPDGTYAAPYVRLDLHLDTSKGKDEQIIDHLINELKAANITPENLGMDVGGAGISLFTILSFRLPGANQILQLNFGESASDLPYSASDKTQCKEKFARLVSEIWYQAKPLIRSGQVRGLHPDLIVEMVSRRYETRAGKIMVETKEDMKKRTLKSPDVGDAGLGVVHLCRTRLGLQCVDRVQGPTKGTSAVSTSRELANKVNAALNNKTTVTFSSSKGAVLWRR